MVRWFQYGVFCPLFRLHGDREPRTPTGHDQTGGPNEVWSYGDEAYEIMTSFLHLRERLRPYLHEQMRLASRDGLPPMRPLFVDSPDDPLAWRQDDEFLLGPDILVAPVTEPGATSRPVYLPHRADGRGWIDVASGESHEGGTSVQVSAPLDRIPVFTAAGAEILDIFRG
jgi:alpha-D-xyloside xylohydrolase